ncbi:MAG TPA: hypothetical protein VMF70_12075 [Gemmatimonadales bacterium]|nr:hypothetical protein [Gemmatimonadales bacterium]
MAHVLRVEHRGVYLYAAVAGDNTPQDVREYLADVQAACVSSGCPRVLIEENLAGPSLGTMDIFAIAAGGGRKAATSIAKIAYLDLNPDHEAKGMQFAENVAVNRGLNVRLFTDRREAEAWLSA